MSYFLYFPGVVCTLTSTAEVLHHFQVIPYVSNAILLLGDTFGISAASHNCFKIHLLKLCGGSDIIQH